MQLPGLHGADPLRILKGAGRHFTQHDLATYAAALAYSALFALFPFLIFLIALLGTLHIPQFFDWLLEQAAIALPSDAFGILKRAIDEIRGESRGSLLSVGIVAAIWAASSGVRSVMNAMNVAFEVEETRPLWKRYALSIVYTVGLAVLFIASAGLILAGPDALRWIADRSDLGDGFIGLWTWLRWPLLALLLTVAVALIYHVAPNVDHDFAIITPGAVVAVLIWLIASAGFSFYVAGFGNYSATYGSLAGIIVLLFFLYLSSIVLLFGAEINAEIHRLDREQNGQAVTIAA